MPSSSLRILVVDDERDTADSFARLLKMSGHSAELAYDAATAVRLAEECSPDLVFFDYTLPDMDGFSLARQLARLPGTHKPVLVCITGHAGADYEERARRVGCARMLVKPIDPEAVVQFVDEIAKAAVGG